MDFSEFEKGIYGKNLEEDEDLMAELLALEQEEEEKKRRSAPAAPPPQQERPPAPAKKSSLSGIDPALLAAALADPSEHSLDVAEDDEELLRELSEITGEESSGSAPPPPVPSRSGIPPAVPDRKVSSGDSSQQFSGGRMAGGSTPTTGGGAATLSQSSHLRQLKAVYEKMKEAADKDNNSAKSRRLQRSMATLQDLIMKSDRGQPIAPSDIPPAPPGWEPSPTGAVTAAAPVTSQASSMRTEDTARPAHHSTANPVRAAAATPTSSTSRAAPAPHLPHPGEVAPTRAAPPVPQRKTSCDSQGSCPPASSSASRMDEVKGILVRRRAAFVANTKAAVAAEDKESAVGFMQMSKMFDQAIEALSSVSADDLDLSEIPRTPPPYRKKVEAKTFMEGLEQRMRRYHEMAVKAQQDGNERKVRMNKRMVDQYKEAILMAQKGQKVDVAELPALPDMVPLLAQFPAGGAGGGAPAAAPPGLRRTPAVPTGPAAGVRPPPSVGPLAPSGSADASRAASQLQFLLQRQQQFKQAAMHAKTKGNMDLAKKYLIEAKGFDKMISASRSGLPVSIKDTPIPPQAATPSASLQPRIVASHTSATGVEGRGEVLALLEKGLIEQVQLAENNRMRFTRLGDVGKVKLFEGWARAAKQDLMLVREVAKQGLQLPKFHYENRQIPSADLFPELAEDIMEFTVVSCKDVPLPSGYEVTHANLFARFTLPYPTESPQSGKTKYVAGTISPEFNETIMFQIGSRKARGQKLARILKRNPLKVEVYQKGSFLRSDKLLGGCEWKLDGLESQAELEESLPLKDGRKAVGGLVTLRIRIREPIGDTKMHITQQKWIILDN